jgi:hypothetical protein
VITNPVDEEDAPDDVADEEQAPATKPAARRPAAAIVNLV